MLFQSAFPDQHQLPAAAFLHKIMVPQIIDIAVILIAIATMLAIGLELRIDALKRVQNLWRNLLVPLALLILIPPLVGLGCVGLLQPGPAVAATILLISACPIGDVANLYTLLARGNPALSFFLNAFTCIVAPLTMALTLPFLARASGIDETFSVPGLSLVLRLLLYIACPVVVGMLWRSWKSGAIRCSLWLQNFSAVLILSVICLILIDQKTEILEFGFHAAFTSSTYILITLGIGLLIVRILRLPHDAASVVSLCFPVRNLAVASIVAVSLMKRLDYAAIIAIYFVIEVPALLVFSFILRRTQRNPKTSPQT